MALRISAALAFLAFWLVALMPLKAVLIAAGGMGGAYQDAYGTIWNGRVHGLSLNGAPVQEVAVSLRPLALLRGQLAVDWQLADSSARGEGRLALGRRQLRLTDTEMTLQASRLGARAWPGLDPAARVFVTIDRLVLDGDRCIEAQGQARTAALVTMAQAYDVSGPVLDGVLGCRDGELRLTLAGESADMSLSGEIVLGRGGYDWDLQASTSRAELADGLVLAGLEREGDLWRSRGHARYDGRND
jgi:hypothetical protein